MASHSFTPFRLELTNQNFKFFFPFHCRFYTSKFIAETKEEIIIIIIKQKLT